MDKKYKDFKEGREVIIEDRIKKRNNLIDEIRLLEWEIRLTESQYKDYMNGDLKPYDALDKFDIINDRDFNYYFSVGTKVKLDWDILSDIQKDKFKHLKNMSAEVTKVSTDLHAFSRGSSYQHELKFDNGECFPKKKLNMHIILNLYI